MTRFDYVMYALSFLETTSHVAFPKGKFRTLQVRLEAKQRSSHALSPLTPPLKPPRCSTSLARRCDALFIWPPNVQPLSMPSPFQTLPPHQCSCSSCSQHGRRHRQYPASQRPSTPSSNDMAESVPLQLQFSLPSRS